MPPAISANRDPPSSVRRPQGTKALLVGAALSLRPGTHAAAAVDAGTIVCGAVHGRAPMSNICLTYAWGKNESISVEIYAEDAFPDAMDEARSHAVRALKETLANVCEIEAADGPAE